MHKLIEFIRSIYLVVLFVVLEALVIGYYARSTYFTQARLLARSNAAAGSVHEFSAGVRRYFRLEAENRILLDRVALLEERLAQYASAPEILSSISCILLLMLASMFSDFFSRVSISRVLSLWVFFMV